MSKDYDVDKRFAHLRVEVLGWEFTDVVRVCETMPDLPEGVSVYVDHIDAVDLKQQATTDDTLQGPVPVDELKKFRKYCRQQAGNQNVGGEFESGYGKAFEKCGNIVEELVEQYE